jgi:hypothetical protein
MTLKTKLEPLESQLRTKSIKPLSNPADYQVWQIRASSALKQIPKAWDLDNFCPHDTEQGSDFLISILSDEYLEQVIDSDLKATTIWNHFKATIMVSSLSSQSIALNDLIAFNYSASNMLENKTVLL